MDTDATAIEAGLAKANRAVGFPLKHAEFSDLLTKLAHRENDLQRQIRRDEDELAEVRARRRRYQLTGRYE
jgi:hypothetical protein